MFTDLKPYLEYRDSGVDAFVRIPGHWEKSRLRGVARLIVSGVDKLTHVDEEPIRLCNYVDVYKHEFITDRLNYMKATATREEIAKFRVRVDDVVITKDSESWTDIGVPAHVVHEADDLVCGYHLALLRTNKDLLTGAYLFRALQVPTVANQFHVAAGGVTRYGLSHGDIRAVQIPVPGLNEQAAIVKYLGQANARIDRAIAAKRKLIALLEEQKQAIINQAVTRGLDPTARLRAPGIPWHSPIPEHWLTIRLGAILVDGPRNGVSPCVAESGDLRSFSISAVRDGVVSVRDEDVKYVARSSVTDVPNYSLRPGDILLVRGNGSIRLVGQAGLLREAIPDSIYPDLLMRMRVNVAAIPEFVVVVLGSSSVRHQIEIAARTAVGTYKLNGQSVRQLRFALPPRDEQLQILAEISRATSSIDCSVALARREIDLLREFRTCLTSDVVTGQLDVREIAAGLPDLDPSDLVGDVGADVEDDLDTDATEFLEDVDA